jgi:outer membrane protein OmpU
MNNFKKIGLTALAGSLVATSAFAGELTATGSAGIAVENITGTADTSTGKAWSMPNSIYLTGSSELDNGMTVSVSYEMDQGTANNSSLGFDNHSVTVSSDTLGTLVFSGHGGSSAQSALDTTAAGDIWNSTLGITGIQASAAGDNSLMYTLPSMVDGLSLSVSMSPGRAAQETHTAWGATYSGFEGLSVSYGVGDSGAPGSVLESSTMKASYAMGPITVAASNTEVDGSGNTNDREVTSYKIAYTVSENLSISYGTETFDKSTSSVDEEVEAISASYTSGGVTLSATQYEAKGAANAAAAKSDKWSLGASFAF